MTNVDLVWETQLTAENREDMAGLFDGEYLEEWGVRGSQREAMDMRLWNSTLSSTMGSGW